MKNIIDKAALNAAVARYLKIVEWSDEDQLFVGRAPGLLRSMWRICSPIRRNYHRRRLVRPIAENLLCELVLTYTKRQPLRRWLQVKASISL